MMIHCHKHLRSKALKVKTGLREENLLRTNIFMPHSDEQRGPWLFTLMLSYYGLNCSKLTCITSIPPKTDVNFYCGVSHSGQNIRDSWTSQEVQRPLGPIFARKSTGRWQMVAQHGGAVQVKALPELWISFSLLLFPGVLYLPSFFSLP